jgi:hypothetical protein
MTASRSEVTRENLRRYSERVDDLKKGESVKVRIPSADPAYAMLAHEDGRVRIVEQVAGEPRELRAQVLGNVGTPLRRDEHPRYRPSIAW